MGTATEEDKARYLMGRLQATAIALGVVAADENLETPAVVQLLVARLVEDVTALGRAAWPDLVQDED